MLLLFMYVLFFFFNDTATTEIYTLSLHDALPISDWTILSNPRIYLIGATLAIVASLETLLSVAATLNNVRSEEHTSELQSRPHLVCRLLLEKKKNTFDNSLQPNNHLPITIHT